MNPHTITYRIKADSQEQHEQLLSDLFAELDQTQPGGLRYEVYRLDDGLSYLHFVFLDKQAHGPLQRPQALKAFHAGLRDRCEGEQERRELTPVGAFGGAVVASEQPGDSGHHRAWRRLHG
jgi:quinol monooxygenase YgiN